jgi:hypothetical protein
MEFFLRPDTGDLLRLKRFFFDFFGGYSNLFATVFRVAASKHQL